jgi:cytochrome c peroxidase
MSYHFTSRGLLAAALLSLAACGGDGDTLTIAPAEPDTAPAPTVEPTLDDDLRGIISERGLSGDAAAGRELPSIEDPLAQLGMKLFYSKALSGDLDVACVTCHHPVLGGGDDLTLSIGVHAEVPELFGPGRRHASGAAGFDGGPTVPRNAPTTFNMALWDKVLFHDGRVESLGGTPGVNGADGEGIRTPDVPFGEADPAAENLTQAQALFPITSAEEMRAHFLAGEGNQVVRDALAERLVTQALPNSWLGEFQVAFDSSAGGDELVTYANMARAIAAYEQSQIFVDTPWRAYVQGDDEALSDAAKRGAVLFYSAPEDGGAGCAGCHGGDFFTDEDFHVLAMPQVGRGKGNGPTGDDDFGRFRETGVEADRYAFRTPALINVTATGPWGHAGAYLTLRDVILHHLDPAAALDRYDWSLADLDPGTQGENAEAHTRAALAQLEGLRAEGLSALPEIGLEDVDVDDLLAFLDALTDPCVEDPVCLAPWIPAREPGPDSLRLNGVDEDGNAL